MNIKDFYAKYNLNKYEFASMAHVGSRTLVKYAEGKPIREDSKKRIEKAMRIVEKHDLVRPRFDTCNSFDSWKCTLHFSEVRKYQKRFEELLNNEET